MSNSILNSIESAFKYCVSEAGFDPEEATVEYSSRPELSVFQSNYAMRLGAKLKKEGVNKSPRLLADEISNELIKHPFINYASAAGPGFINISPDTRLIIGRANELFKDNYRSGVSESTDIKKIVMDYGGPNIAKPMHVGHLRSAIIGESLKNIARFLGHEVVADIHLGDWGLQMGLLIAIIEEKSICPQYYDRSISPSYEYPIPIDISDLASLYPEAAKRAKSDADFKKKAQTATADLQAGFWGYHALLQHFKKISITDLKRQYDNLGVSFDLWKGESDVHGLVDLVINEFKDKGLAEEDDGALIARLDDCDDSLPPLILKSSAGSALYGTTDLATLMERKNEINPDLIFYIVDQRQSQHFSQVFCAAHLAGWFDEGELEHLGFGTVNGKDGKPFKTRDGGVMELAELMNLINRAAEYAYDKIRIKRNFETTAFIERGDVADKVGKAAVKFADLQNPRTSNYIFDIDRFVAFEGKTGPYLQYQTVRARKVLDDARFAEVKTGTILPFDDHETQLIFDMDKFDSAVHKAFDKRAPHILCDHLYELSQNFSRFYKFCPILKDGVDPKIMTSRVSLCVAFVTQMELGLALLGIEVPNKM